MIFSLKSLVEVKNVFSCSYELNLANDASIPIHFSNELKNLKPELSNAAANSVIQSEIKKELYYSEIWSKIDQNKVLTDIHSVSNYVKKDENVPEIKRENLNNFLTERSRNFEHGLPAKDKNKNKCVRVFENNIKSLNLSQVKNENIALKIFSQQKDQQIINEYILPAKKMISLLKKYPSLKEIVSNESEKITNVDYTPRAIITLINSQFDPDKLYYKNTDVAIEAYAFFKKFEIWELTLSCFEYLMCKVRLNDFESEKVVRYIDYYNIPEIIRCLPVKWKSIKHLYRYTDISSFELYHNPNCNILWTHHQPHLHDIYFILLPLERVLEHSSDVDIRNRAVLKTISGSFCIKGIQIKLNDEFTGKSPLLDMFYKVQLHRGKKTKTILEEEVQRNLDSSIPIMFRENICVDSKQSVEISVTVESVLTSLCSYSPLQEYVQKTKKGDFRVSLFSSRKSNSEEPVFFIEKIFYS